MALTGEVCCPDCDAVLQLELKLAGVYRAQGPNVGPYAVVHVTGVTGCEHVDPPKGPACDETVPDSPALALVAHLGDWFGCPGEGSD